MNDEIVKYIDGFFALGSNAVTDQFKRDLLERLVSVESQTFTTGQKLQARTNIGASSVETFLQLSDTPATYPADTYGRMARHFGAGLVFSTYLGEGDGAWALDPFSRTDTPVVFGEGEAILQLGVYYILTVTVDNCTTGSITVLADATELKTITKDGTYEIAFLSTWDNVTVVFSSTENDGFDGDFTFDALKSVALTNPTGIRLFEANHIDVAGGLYWHNQNFAFAKLPENFLGSGNLYWGDQSAVDLNEVNKLRVSDIITGDLTTGDLFFKSNLTFHAGTAYDVTFPAAGALVAGRFPYVSKTTPGAELSWSVYSFPVTLPGASSVPLISAAGAGTWLTESAIAKLSGLTSGYVPFYNGTALANSGLFWDAINSEFELTGNQVLTNTTNASKFGIIYKGSIPFIHDFNYGNNGSVTTDGYNTCIGLYAGNLTMGSTATQTYHSSNNNFVGYAAGYLNTTGYYNNFLGAYAGRSNTTGYQNNFLGAYAGYSNTTGSYNNFVGYGAGYSNTTGYYNNFLGAYAGYLNTTGYQNNFLGAYAGYSNTTGSYNNFVGYGAGYSNTTGYYNNFLGYAAGYSNTTGSNNNFLGAYAGRYIADGITGRTTGNNGTYVGTSTKASANGTDNEIVIGYNATGLGSNTVVLGNSSILTTALRGNVGIGTTIPTSRLHIAAGTATAGTSPLKFTSGTLLTAPEAGAVEFLTDAYYATITTGTARKTFAFLESPVFTGTVTTPAIKITTGAAAGYFLTSAADGTASWAAITSSKWVTDTYGIKYDAGKVGIGGASKADESLYVYGAAGKTAIGAITDTTIAISGTSTSSVGIYGASTSGVGVQGDSTNSYSGYFGGTHGLYTSKLTIGNLVFPTTDGTANQVLKTNGSGVLEWVTVAASLWTTDTYGITYNVAGKGVGIGTASVENVMLKVVGASQFESTTGSFAVKASALTTNAYAFYGSCTYSTALGCFYGVDTQARGVFRGEGTGSCLDLVSTSAGSHQIVDIRDITAGFTGDLLFMKMVTTGGYYARFRGTDEANKFYVDYVGNVMGTGSGNFASIKVGGTTRIASDGTFTPSNGVSGSWTTTDGKTITATNGIITAIV